jgi:mono/diheme cytochrome c family protein
MIDSTILSTLLLGSAIMVTLIAVYLTYRHPRSLTTVGAWIGGLALFAVNAALLFMPPTSPAATAPAVPVNPVPSTAESLMQGQVLYNSTCLRCHGDSMTGDGPEAAALPVPPANLRDHIPHHEDGDHFLLITNGKGTMPAFGTVLSETERWHLINYLRDATATEMMGEMDGMEH